MALTTVTTFARQMTPSPWTEKEKFVGVFIINKQSIDNKKLIIYRLIRKIDILFTYVCHLVLQPMLDEETA